MPQLKSIIFINCLVILWLNSCDLQKKQEKADLLTTQKSRHVGYLRIPLQDPVSTIDPGLTIANHSIEVVEQLFLGLTDFNPKTYQVMPELATHWKLSQGGMFILFTFGKMRNGLMENR